VKRNEWSSSSVERAQFSKIGGDLQDSTRSNGLSSGGRKKKIRKGTKLGKI